MVNSPHRLNSLLSGTGTFLTLLSQLFLAHWYSFESIGDAGVLLAWISVIGLIATGKLDNVAFNTTDIKLSNSALITGLLLSSIAALLSGLLILLGFYVFATVTDFSYQLTIVSIVIIAGLGGTQLGAVRLQKESKIVQLGFSRLLRGAVGLVSLYYLSPLGSIGILIAFGLGQLSSFGVSMLGWSFANFQRINFYILRDGFSITVSSILVSLTEAIKLMIFEVWLSPDALGLFIYLSRIIKGAMIWPGQPLIDNMLSKYTMAANSVSVYMKGSLNYIFSVGLVGAFTGLLVIVYLSLWNYNSIDNTVGWWSLAVIELVLTSLLVIYRRIPIMIRNVKIQVRAELLFFTISLFLFGFSSHFFNASPIVLITLVIISNWLTIGFYQFTTGYSAKGNVLNYNCKNNYS